MAFIIQECVWLVVQKWQARQRGNHYRTTTS
jgi:hypothetical protein